MRILYAVKPMPRPRSLTQAGIAAAALAVLDREGLAALSMRAVAGELGMSTMALYRYVADREQLEGLLVDHVLSAVDLERPTRASWRRQVSVLVERVRTAAAAHPAAVPLLLTHRHSSTASLYWTEAMLEVLTRAGFTGTERVIALRTLVAYLLGALQSEHLGPLSGPGTAAMTALTRDEFPNTADTARSAQRVTPDAEFRRGLAVVLRGLKPGD